MYRGDHGDMAIHHPGAHCSITSSCMSVDTSSVPSSFMSNLLNMWHSRLLGAANRFNLYMIVASEYCGSSTGHSNAEKLKSCSSLYYVIIYDNIYT